MKLSELRKRTAPAAVPAPAPAPRANRGPSQFGSLGEQLRSIARAEAANTVQDPRLGQIQRRAAAGASEMVPADGGFLIAPDFTRDLMARLYQTGEIIARCRELPIDHNSFAFPQIDESSRATGSRLGGVQAWWGNEGAPVLPTALQTASKTMKPSFNLSTLTASKLTGYLTLSNELSIDSAAFDTWASYAMGEELLFVLEQAIVGGTGAGQPQGVLSSPALIQVAKQSGQSSGTVVSANISGMIAAFWAKSYTSRASLWLYNQALLPQLAALTTSVGTGGSEAKLWQWRASDDDYDRLAGLPAIPSEYCLYPGTPGDIILCDFSRYVIGMRQQIRGEVSIHVNFLSDQSTFRFVLRATGQTIDRSPVAALNGGSPPYVTSPFVALGPR